MKSRNTKRIAILVFCGIFIVLSIFIITDVQTGVASPGKINPATSPASLIHVGLMDNFTNTKLPGSLVIDPGFAVDSVSPVQFHSDLANGTVNINVLVLANVSFNPVLIGDIQTYLDSRNGRVFLILGQYNASQAKLLYNLGLLDAQTMSIVNGIAIWTTTNTTNHLVSDIDWNAVPEIRTWDEAPWNATAINVLLRSQGDNSPMLVEANHYAGRFIIFTPWISADNLDFELCLQFNYFNYHMLRYLAGQPSLSYLDWPYSPVLHDAQRIDVYIWLVVITAIGVGGYALMRRISKSTGNREINLARVLAFGKSGKKGEETSIEEKAPPVVEAEMKNESPPDLDVHPVEEAERNTPAPEIPLQPVQSPWEQIGMHRQIAQFFFNMILSFFVAVPIMILALYIYPNFIQPYPMVSGWQSIAGAFFGFLPTIFDMGISTAAVKFFSQYRVKNPQKAVHYLQLLAWWNIFTSIAKSAIVAFAGMYFFTYGNISYLGWVCMLIAFQQFPNVQGIIGTTLDSMQRWDYKVPCDIIGGTVINTFLNYGLILLFRAIFAGNPLFGDAFGAVVGLYISAIITSWTSFLYYNLAFKKLGFHVGTLFKAEFTWDEVKEAFRFGWKLAFGNVIVPLVSTLETYMIATFVLNSGAELGYWAMMANVTNFVGIDLGFFNNLKPGISEAHGNGKMQLVKYYCTEGLHYINLFSFVLFAVILAAGGPVLVGFTGSFWAPAEKYVAPLCIFQLATIYSGVCDTILQGTGNTHYNAYAWIIEQSTRAVLLVLIMPVFHPLWAIYLASIPAALLKEAVTFTIIRKKIVKFDWAIVHNFLAPIASAIVLYFFILLLLKLIYNGSLISSAVLFLVAVFAGMIIYLFLLGFFGGWDDNTLAQFKRGLGVVKFVSVLFLAFYKTTELGHRCCPWKNKFRVTVFNEATAEAAALTAEKKKLVM